MMGLAPAIEKALAEAGLDTPTPIQKQAIPLALQGDDILGLAQTGTGKTLAFGLPLIEHVLQRAGKPAPKTVKALVLAPTRELVNQIAENLRGLTAKTRVKVTTVVGGQSIRSQMNRLERGSDILVATPGRLIDLMERKAVDLGTVSALVLDEADQMLDMGFIHALRQIAPALGTPRPDHAVFGHHVEADGRTEQGLPEQSTAHPGRCSGQGSRQGHAIRALCGKARQTGQAARDPECGPGGV